METSNALKKVIPSYNDKIFFGPVILGFCRESLGEIISLSSAMFFRGVGC